jgi:Salt tolerance down-regulator
MVDMTTPSRRIYNRTASAHINVSSPSSPPSSTSTPQAPRKSSSPPPPTLVAPTAPVGSKKKKKKRSKAKSGNGLTPLGDEDLDYSRRDGYDDAADLTDDDIPDLVDIDTPVHTQSLSIPMTANSSTSSKTPTTTSAGSKSKKKKKKGKGGSTLATSNGVESHAAQTGDYGQQQKIWNTTTAEEKERIKEFWLGLSEQERRNLVRVEKEHVSKRVKEGSKILNCSCHVCGRKQSIHHSFKTDSRVAIEEELDVLYDAYYEELENYSSPHAIQFGPEPPPDLYEDEEDDEEYDDEEDYDDSQDGDDYHHHHHHHHHHHGLPDEYVETRREIFNFGANLMAKGQLCIGSC